jgi:hypothetical protein
MGAATFFFGDIKAVQETQSGASCRQRHFDSLAGLLQVSNLRAINKGLST